MESKYNNRNATFIKRVYSFLIDILLVIIINTILIILVSMAVLFFNNVVDINSYELLSKIIFYCSIISYMTYFSVLDSNLTRGSIGKRFLKITLVGKNGERINLLKSIIRSIIKYISVFSIIGVIPIFITRNRQALHDILLNTFVINNRE